MDEASANNDAVDPALLEESMEDLYDRAPCGYLSARIDGRIVKVNRTLLSWLGHEEAEEIVGARSLGYLLMPGLGDALVAANGWDVDALAAVRAHPRFAGLDYGAVKRVPTGDLGEVSHTLPGRWLTDAAATGTAAACAARLGDYLAAGADGVLLHGSTIDALAGVVDACTTGPPNGA